MMNDLNEMINGLSDIFGFNNEPDSDVIEYKDGYMVLTDLPGVDKKNIEVSYENKTLTISVKENKKEDEQNGDFRLSERNHKFDDKAISLESDVDFSNASAQCENGVLRIYLPKITKKVRNIVID